MYKEFDCAEYETANASCETRRCEKFLCTNAVIAFLAALLTFTIGLIVGVLAAVALAVVLPVLIALAIVFAVLIVVILLLRYCQRESRCGCRRCD